MSIPEIINILTGLPVCGDAVLVLRKYTDEWFQALIHEIKPTRDSKISYILSNRRVLLYSPKTQKWQMVFDWNDPNDSDESVYSRVTDVDMIVIKQTHNVA